MARLARLCIPGQPHLVQQRGHNGQPVFIDETDVQGFLRMLAAAAKANGVAIHAYGLATGEVHLLATPGEAESLSRLMQAVGRQHGQAFNRRHGRSGSLWDGRFRTAPIQAEQHLLAAMRYVESAVEDLRASSAAHHLGHGGDVAVSDHSLYWALGNTPFDREMKYREWFDQGTAATEADRFRRAVAQGWPLGDASYIEQLAQMTTRRLAARPRGRPAKTTP